MASDPEKTASVFDILYADTRRLSSLLAQLNDEGVLTEISRAAEDATSTNVELSVKVVKAGSNSAGRESKTTKIDPTWLLPLLFLDSAQDLIKRDIESAAIGSIVLNTGKLIVTDMSVLQELWKSPVTKRQLLKAVADAAAEQDGANRHERRAAGKKGKTDSTENELVLEILPLLPHSPQFNIVTMESAVWGTFDPKYLVGTVADLTLKHGAKVPGAWSVVGILDALPWEERGDEDYDDFLSYFEQVRIGMTGDNLWKLATQLAAPARQTLGRPFLSYGVTPLIIFREIER